MLWCRDAFEDVSSLQNHIFTCSWLADGCYWCPDCQCAERFMEPEVSSEPASQKVVPRRESALTCAAMFFKQFGRGSSSKRRLPRFCLTAKLNALIDKIFGRRRLLGYAELENCEPLNLEGVKGSTRAGYHGPNSHRLVYTEEVSGQLPLKPANGGSSRTSFRFRSLHEMADCTWVRYELDCVRGMVSELSTSEPCWSSTELPSKPVVGFHAQYAERDMEEADTVGRQEAVSPLLGHQSPTTRTVSPLSATHESPTIDEIAGQEASPHTWPYPTVVGGPMTPSQLGLKDRPKASAPLTISTHSHEPSPGGDSIVHACFRRGAALSRVSKWYSTAAGNIESRSLTAKTQIEDLRALVLVVNNEWTQRMTSDLELTPRCSTLPPRTLLEIGVKALKRYFRGTLPDTFVDVFALMHVACAFAYMLHKDDESYCCDCWEEFFQDMLQWQYAIAEESEVQIFLKAMDRLGSPETPSSALFGECRLSNHLPRQIAHKQAPNPRPKLDISCKLDPFLPQPGSEPFQQPSVAPNRAELWNRLKSGKVIKDCSTFLDGKSVLTYIRSAGG